MVRFYRSTASLDKSTTGNVTATTDIIVIGRGIAGVSAVAELTPA